MLLKKQLIIFLDFFFFTGNGASVSIPDESIKEICAGDTICEDIKLEANTSQIIEVILRQQQSNTFLQCSIRPNEEPKCAPDSSVSFKYKRETQILQFCMIFNQTKHSENKLVVKRNEEIYLKILLLPCSKCTTLIYKISDKKCFKKTETFKTTKREHLTYL